MRFELVIWLEEKVQNSKITDERSGDQLRIAITGASGYLGGALVDLFQKKGFVVYRLTSSSKRDGSSLDQYTIEYSLGEALSADFFKRNNIDVLIHCAYDFNLVDWKKIEQVNVGGSVELMRAAKEQGVERILFISTMSAFDGCASLYGRAKMEIEREAVRLGVTIIRPGLIYSEQPGSMMQKLTKAVRAFPVLPGIISARQTLYLVHLDDLALLIFTAVTKGISADQPIIAASDQGKTLSQILDLIAKGQHKTIVLLPVPWRVIWAALKLFESFGLRVGLRSDSVVSLVNQDPAPRFEVTQKTGIPFRDFGEYIATSSSS
jgi:nucleoside-diphosphate-sugar epimerase